jgi:hypothetical protein
MALQHDWKLKQISTTYDEFDVVHYSVQYVVDTYSPETLPHMMSQYQEIEVSFNPHIISETELLQNIKSLVDVKAIELFGEENLSEMIIPVVEVI